MFTKDCGPCLPVYLQRTAVLISRFVYKGPQSLSSAIHLQRTAALCWGIHFQRTAVLVFAIHLQRTAALVWCYLFAKDRCPCLRLFICKGLRYLSYVIHLQRTAVLILCH